MCRDSHLLILQQCLSYPLSHHLQDHTQDIGTGSRILNPNILTPDHNHPYIPLLPLFTICKLSKTSDYQGSSLVAQIFPGKGSAFYAGDLGSVPGSGRSPGEGNGNPLQYSCLENPMDGGTWLDYSPWGRKESDTTERLHSLAHSDYQCLLFHSVHYFLLLPNLSTTKYLGFIILFCILNILQFSSVQSLSRVWLFATPWLEAQHSYDLANQCQSCHPFIFPRN